MNDLELAVNHSTKYQFAGGKASPPKRLPSLDGIRGIAALIVLFSHLADAVPSFYLPHPPFSSLAFWTSPLALLKYTPLRVFVAGRAMVLVFFVLSGFVLCHSDRGLKDYAGYLIKRFLRIYPPFAMAILGSCFLYILVKPNFVPVASVWFNNLNWSTPPSSMFILSNLVMLGVPEWPTIDSATWSLIHEMRISLIFPLIVFSLRRYFYPTLISSLALGFLNLYFISADPYVMTLQLTVGYMAFFFVGASLSLRKDALFRQIKIQSKKARSILWFLSGIALVAPMNVPVDSFVPGLGAALFIPLVLSSDSVSRFFESKVPQWLGRVSFSLYLIHLPILLSLTHLFGGKFPLGELCALTLMISLAAAELCHRLVEVPSIRLGRMLAKNFQISRVDGAVI